MKQDSGSAIDLLIQVAAGITLFVLFLMLLTSSRPYAIPLSFAALIAAIYFAAGAIDSALGGRG